MVFTLIVAESTFPQPVRKPVTLEKLESFAMLSDNADDAQNYISKMRTDRVF